MKATSRLLRVLIESEFLPVPVGSAYYRATQALPSIRPLATGPAHDGDVIARCV